MRKNIERLRDLGGIEGDYKFACKGASTAEGAKPAFPRHESMHTTWRSQAPLFWSQIFTRAWHLTAAICRCALRPRTLVGGDTWRTHLSTSPAMRNRAGGRTGCCG